MPTTPTGDAMQGMKPLVAGADGTSASAGGLTLEPKRSVFSAGHTMRWKLHVIDRMGMTVTEFERDQTKLMHLIVIRSDLTDYQHLHPILGSDGTFEIGLRLPGAGSYRAIADFTTGGRRYALGVSIWVPGAGTQASLPAEAMTATTDGFSVQTMHGEPIAGKETEIEFTIGRSGHPVTGLLPYLSAYGHLVALHERTIAYSHVHPTSQDRAKGSLRFAAEFPTSGSYRLFLQFRTTSGVHTAPFTIKAKAD